MVGRYASRIPPGQPGMEARACLLLSQIQSGTQAEKSARRARDLARQASLAHVDILALTREAELALAAGDLEDAEQSSAEALHKLTSRLLEERAFLILILDDATSSVDTETEDEIRIISMRKAVKHEQNLYFKNLFG